MISKVKITILAFVVIVAVNVHMFRNHFFRETENQKKTLLAKYEMLNETNKSLIAQQSKLLVKDRIVAEAEKKLAFQRITEDDPQVVNIYNYENEDKINAFVLLDLITPNAEAKTK